MQRRYGGRPACAEGGAVIARRLRSAPPVAFRLPTPPEPPR
ncbi:hypothetical protein RQM47_10480 [Rubrivirga sp. S365]|uniref:Uncharacterized protein n=1 Tax=Rubrivirga litoralis TaxID=3075598 RepID=A0ABU3BSA1_9BACT|nr:MULTISPECIES: hypothetical protein [unclassified Rubrivirga]MDT0632173.1 hypothetical protein [Rubrivirga sp. F394]MDT7857067.1 hypothetical protein [Rubrivirga sp. S365]